MTDAMLYDEYYMW